MRIVWHSIISYFWVALLFSSSLFAQNGVIFLNNPSFEDFPRHSQAPRGWTDCGFVGESAPDVHPDYVFQVNKLAFDGNTYLGMVVRDNETWESVGQLMSSPMKKGTCYEFSIKLARSLTYMSISRESGQDAPYTQPVKLRIWGGFGSCDKQQMMGETPLIKNPDWMQYSLKLSPNDNFTHIVLEVFYNTPNLFPYNGNLLLDGASELQPVACDKPIPKEPQVPKVEDPLLASNTPKAPPSPQVTPVQVNPKPTTPQSTSPTSLAGVKRSEMTAGKTILLENIQFESDSSRLIKSSLPTLEELYNFLAANPDVSVEVGGHTNGWAEANYAIRLSTARAKAVAEYLTDKGINPARVKYKGYGKAKPIDTNDTPAGRRRNQRVEIKILGTG
ncbi:MAG: OmpA family protein [Saprospiraceae bacterium]